jgi:OmpA family protein
MKTAGLGSIGALLTNWRWEGETQWADSTVLLYNFDIDESELKPKHLDFLHDQVIPDLRDNPGARVAVVGTASMSGEGGHNEVLSENRAKAVMKHLIAKGVEAFKFKPSEPIGVGDAPAGPSKEDDRDRGVTLQLKFPLTIEEVSLRTDDWKNQLWWDDIVGLDRADDGKPIKKINIQLTASGAPKSWNLVDKGLVLVMPAEMLVRLRSHPPLAELGVGYPTILAPKGLSIPMKDPDRPSSEARTLYRLAYPIDQAGDFMKASEEFSEVATVVRPDGSSDVSFRAALRWASRGGATQNPYGGDSGSERDESPAALRLLQAGGVEVLEVEALSKADPKKRVLKRLIRNPADVFYYAGDGSEDGCLAIGNNCWVSPMDLQRYWKPPFDLGVLILAGCSVLSMTVREYFPGIPPSPATGGPGVGWSALLRDSGGPLTAILGYRDKAPIDNPTGKQIAAQMGAKIAAGLAKDQWVPTWLKINAEHLGHHTWNAVGMDDSGYWLIHKRTKSEKFMDDRPVSLLYGGEGDYSISKPVPILSW